MTNCERLEPRQFLSAGVDLTFDADGAADLTFGVQGATAMVPLPDGSVVVALRFDGDTRLRRINENGTLDANWSGDGTYELDFVVEHLLYDPKRNRLIAASGELSSSLQVERIRLDGSSDPTFDGDGRFAYSPASGAYLVDIVPQARGGLLLVLQTYHSELYDARDYSGLTQLLVMKLRPDGTRDVTLRRRGVRALFSGSSGGSYDPEYGDSASRESTYTVVDAQVQPDNSTRLLLLDHYEASNTYFYYAEERLDTAHIVWIEPDGRTRESGTFSTELLNASWDDFSTNRSNELQFAGGHLTDAGGTIFAASRRSPLQRLDLFPNRRPRVTKLEIEGFAQPPMISRTDRGDFWIVGSTANSASQIARFGSRLRPDVTWGDKGFVELNTNARLTLPDLFGRLLIATDTQLLRLNARRA